MNSKLSRVFYGWWVVGAGFLIWLLMGGFVIFGFTAFFEPIANEFGWSYAQISFAASLRGMESGILAPLLGLIVDRWGPRRLMFGGILILGVSLALLSLTTSLVMFYIIFALVAIGLSGNSPTVAMTAVANWFRKKVGIATGIMSCGIALSGLLIPLVVKLIDVFEWRTAIFILGITILVICLPLSLLVRHKPEKYGYLPDGEQINSAIHRESPVLSQTGEVDSGVKQALKSRAFWHIGLATAFQFLASSAVFTHVMPYLSSVGIARSTSSLVVMGTPIISIVGRLGSGWLSDRLNRRLVVAGCLTSSCLGILFFSYTTNEEMGLLIPFVVLFGIGWGGIGTMRAVLMRAYFGRSNFGTILGFIMAMQAIGNIIGPLFAGWVFDSWGSYNTAWLVFAFTLFAGIIIIVTMPPVRTNLQVPDNT
ncbi:MFS transporter [Chloroflexota bacterium]